MIAPTALSSLFVTGTDTGVGKTHIACQLLRHWQQFGFCVAPMKPIASGAERVNDQLLNDDVSELMCASGRAWPAHLVNPYCFEPPIAPHIAAELAHQEIKLNPILQAYALLAAQSDAVIVEGAGGVLVPLSTTLLMTDLIRALELPVLLVIGLRLGCINHALLSVSAIERAGLKLEGWVGNHLSAEPMLEVERNLLTLNARIDAPCWGVEAYLVDKSAKISPSLPPT